MLKKITGSILTIMLMAGMFLGAVGVVIPEPVHAADEKYPGPYELKVKLDKVYKDGADVTGNFEYIKVKLGETVYPNYPSGFEVTISRLSECPTLINRLEICKTGSSWWGQTSWQLDPNGGTISGYPVDQGYVCDFTYTITHYHEKDHKWKYSAKDNVITAECTAENTCPLEAPTLTLNTNDKEYDGKPAAAVSPNSTWTTANGLPEPDQSKIIYSSDSPKNAGTYIASYTVDGATAAKQYTIQKKPVIVSGFEVLDKEYDGTTKATVDTSGFVIIGKVSGDDLNASVTGEFENADEGWDKTVYLTYELTGADAGNYYAAESLFSPKTVKAKIYVRGNGGPDDYDEDGDNVKGSGSGKAAGTSKNSPNTGDENDITGLLAMMLVSAGALGAMGYRRRRENRR